MREFAARKETSRIFRGLLEISDFYYQKEKQTNHYTNIMFDIVKIWGTVYLTYTTLRLLNTEEWVTYVLWPSVLDGWTEVSWNMANMP
jgi:hypothetical protein